MSVRTQPLLHPDDEIGDEPIFRPRPRSSTKRMRDDYDLVVADAQRLVRSFSLCVREEIAKKKAQIEEAMEDRAYDRGRCFLENDIPFRVNCEKMLAMASMEPAQVQYRADLLRRGGVGLHENQIRTLVALMIESSLELTKPGVVLGPMQSGKTGLSLAIAVFMAPLMYQLAGVKFFPLFLSTHLDVHAEQTKKEFEAVMSLYGGLEIEVSTGRITPSAYYNLVNVMQDHYRDHAAGFDMAEMEAVYEDHPTPSAYRNVIMRDKLTQSTDDVQIVYSRRNGKQVAELKRRMRELTDAGFSLLLLIDEPQYGASGDCTPTGKFDRYGAEKFKGVVIKQIMQEQINELLSQDGKHMAIMISATPFDSAAMSGVWVQRSYLSPNYIGYNCWGGKMIDDTVWLRPPVLHSFSEMAEKIGNPDVVDLRNLLGAGRKDADFTRGAPALMATLDYLFANRKNVADEIRDIRPELSDRLDDMLAESYGGCIRFVSDNAKTDRIIRETKLDEHYQVFKYYGGVLVGQDRGQALTAQEVLEQHWDRADPRPPLFVVTNLARMGDNFPRVIESFIDLANTAGDMNALLQGLNGRSCGESKFLSQVMLCDDSVGRLRDYVETLGVAVHKGSPHSLTVDGAVRRGRGHKMVRLTTLGNDDPMVARFMQLVNERIVWDRFSKDGKRVPQGKLPSNKAPFYDVRSIISEVRDEQDRDLMAYLADPAVQDRLFPHMDTMQIANPLDPETKVRVMKRNKATGVREPKEMGYGHTDDGLTKVSFRSRPTSEIESGHYGITDRDQRDRETAQTDRAITDDGLEIQINVLKRKSLRANAAEVMTRHGEGYPEAYMVTFPLLQEVRPKTVIEGRPTTITNEKGWLQPAATDAERELQKGYQAALEERKALRARRHPVKKEAKA